MNNADAQVINMVNRPHEERERRARQARQAKRRQTAFRKWMLELILRLEIYVIALGLIFIATAHGWVTGWLGALGTVVCIAGCTIEVVRPMKG